MWYQKYGQIRLCQVSTRALFDYVYDVPRTINEDAMNKTRGNGRKGEWRLGLYMISGFALPGKVNRSEEAT